MKYVYLDQMHWIALAKAASGHRDGSRFVPVLNAVKDAVANRRAVLPLSFAHIFETAKSPRPDQRKALAALMTCLSAGVVLCWSRPLVEFHLRNSVRRLFALPLLAPEPSPFGRGVEDVLGFDLLARLGGGPERAAQLRRSLDTPAAWIDLLAYKDEVSRKLGIESVERIANECVEENELRRATWAGKNGDFTRRAYAVSLTKTFWLELQRALHEVGRTIEEWGRVGTKCLMEFWESIPRPHVEMELHTQMHRQNSKPWKRNCHRDIDFLADAIPACDVVVTEAFWVDLSHRRNLHQRYDTVLLSDLTDLNGQL
ncbi:MAG: hypothetical protein ACREJC_01395 [Tepidisphaeraceae bacterium]